MSTSASVFKSMNIAVISFNSSGEWMLGLRHGDGVLTFANGASYSGRWEFDKVIHLTD